MAISPSSCSNRAVNPSVTARPWPAPSRRGWHHRQYARLGYTSLDCNRRSACWRLCAALLRRPKRDIPRASTTPGPGWVHPRYSIGSRLSTTSLSIRLWVDPSALNRAESWGQVSCQRLPTKDFQARPMFEANRVEVKLGVQAAMEVGDQTNPNEPIL